MPVQTNKKANIFFPDGAKVSVKTAADADWFDVGAINSSVTNTLNWTESVVETANAGKLDQRVSNMEIAGGFTLINLDPVGIAKLGGGVFDVEERTGTAATPAAQNLANVVVGEWYAMELGMRLPASVAKPVITSITADGDTLTENTDYTIVKVDGDYKIKFVAAADAVVITYGSNTPVEGTTVYGGNSTIVMKPYAVYSNTGGFQFNFKGANEDGVEEMPLTYTARLDTNKTNNRQLFAWTIENGAA